MRSINTQETFVYFAGEAGMEDERMDGSKGEGDPSQSDWDVIKVQWTKHLQHFATFIENYCKYIRIDCQRVISKNMNRKMDGTKCPKFSANMTFEKRKINDWFQCQSLNNKENHTDIIVKLDHPVVCTLPLLVNGFKLDSCCCLWVNRQSQIKINKQKTTTPRPFDLPLCAK